MKHALITGARAPVALHWARMFAESGWRVSVADCCPRPIAAASTRVSQHLNYPSPALNFDAFKDWAEANLSTGEFDLILPTCEEVFYFALVAENQAWQAQLFAPKLTDLLVLHDKFSFNQRVVETNPSFAPMSVLIQSKAELMALDCRELVVKPVFSRFGTEVFVCPEREALEALNPSQEQPWIAQEFVPGEELCLSAVVHQGQLSAYQVYKPIIRTRGEIGAGVVFESVVDDQSRGLGAFVSKLIDASVYSGLLSFDFRRDRDGQLRVLECNPRATSGFHFFNQPQSLVRAVTEGEILRQENPARIVMGDPFAGLAFGGFRALKLLPKLRSLSAWPGDSLGPLSQLRSFLALRDSSRRQGLSLEAASTHDIAWNGFPAP